MCLWVFDGARINFDRITAFETSFWQLFYKKGYYHLLLHFLKDTVHTLQICLEHNEDMHVTF